MYANANAFKEKVKLTFFHGAELPDPGSLFNSGFGGKRWRAIDIRRGDAVDEPALRELLRAAVACGAAHSVLRSRGSLPL